MNGIIARGRSESGVLARAVRGLEAGSLVAAGVGNGGTAVGAPAAKRLQTEERLARIRRLDGRVNDRPGLSPQVAAEKGIGLTGALADGEGEPAKGLKGVFSEEGILDHAAGARVAARSLQAAG
jgi:hypothetical protein